MDHISTVVVWKKRVSILWFIEGVTTSTGVFTGNYASNRCCSWCELWSTYRSSRVFTWCHKITCSWDYSKVLQQAQISSNEPRHLFPASFDDIWQPVIFLYLYTEFVWTLKHNKTVVISVQQFHLQLDSIHSTCDLVLPWISLMWWQNSDTVFSMWQHQWSLLTCSWILSTFANDLEQNLLC